jgi:hypothetical protein
MRQPASGRIVPPAIVLMALTLLTPGPWAEAQQPESEKQRLDQPRRVRMGLKAAKQRYGANLPTGRGIVVGQVEGLRNRYLPNVTKDKFQGVRFVRRSGESKPFGHANYSGGLIYGRNGFAPGVTEVHAFASQHWLGEAYLRTDSDQPPRESKADVFNHSWIANAGGDSIPALRRVDYQIDQRGVVMCAGVNNGADTSVPHLMTSAYNVIAVGVDNGKSSGGYTQIEGKGRCKPELVAPHHKTSFSTPIVTACAARLLETARKIAEGRDDHEAGAKATRPEVIKVVLLTGATKPGDWSAEANKPLDEHYGAGVVHLERSLRILATEPTGPGKLERSSGWDYRSIGAKQSRTYKFTVNRPLGELSLTITWHRKVDGLSGRFREDQAAGWSYATGLANFDLELIRLNSNGTPHTVASSTTEIDNVEHIYRDGLEPGRYRIKVTRKADGLSGDWPYALAWHAERPNQDQ